MMSWLYKNKLTHVDGFEFKKLPRIDRGDEAQRRPTFTDDEIKEIKLQLWNYIGGVQNNIEDDGNLVRVIVCYYLLISIITGLRRGEQLQLKWHDIEWLERNVRAAMDSYP
jgi:integrase